MTAIDPSFWEQYAQQDEDQVIDLLTRLRDEAQLRLDLIAAIRDHEATHTQRPEITGFADDAKDKVDDWTSKWTSKWGSRFGAPN